ncbi:MULTISPECIES: NADP-dependent isocitrate dehydrogenase [Kocuria]|jgi:isocitrate dehydrogenase|uniref:NADP-dependent isocitrate dehydrogenase n=1 Tax=Kocuria TaxID=57493 RepID=UPI000362FD88|nr:MULTISPECIES: NADP-dependent isocitrate dehydrogenase [Kocuria]MCC5782872.1 isocitrate dehydrogenase (NADP(+)) [Kocuria sp. CCUG 69068]EYT55143.1 isocitrate dehydrogenase [Kocuria sp. UCD-OTCP]NVC24551.1 NADP-dependent isocitrate dehydrogenase [Kocuria salina]PWF80819.1 NADP-dependent isocitrate dehydrogenase [Kocuria rosea]PWF89042.1 NADP-dependent isocitrate dehydrogenase [Kocuria rosea]
MAKIIYTRTDEAPLLATYSFKPIIEAYASTAGVEVETRDISLAGRIIAAFGDRLPEEQRVDDALAELGELAKKPEANIIKLPNISASVPQLKAAVKELQEQGVALPDYPDEPRTEEEKETRARYDKIKGSAVNPVLREGNSDRRAPASVKNYVRKNPHRMGEWTAESRTNVATMGADDFRDNEKSVVMDGDDTLTIRLVAEDGSTTVLKESVPVLAGEVVDGTVMRAAALDAFLAEQVERAKREDVLLSVHLKATMMKVSDPIIFGHVIEAFFPELFAAHGAALEKAGLSPANGLAAILNGLDALPADVRDDVRAAIDKGLAEGPKLAMVNSDKGITNLHVPSDVIVDASMPAMIRTSGHMWGPEGEEADTLAVLPDSSYAGVYQVVIDDCRAHGAFDPTTMGSVPNVGLMAMKAEEYGSHDKTFEIPVQGTVQVVDSSGAVLIEHEVSPGDIWRACQTKDVAIRDWVKLAVTRARASATPAVFWLDRTRAHDTNLIAKVEQYLTEHDTEGLQIEIMSPEEATAFSIERIRRGEDTISVTGNVLRDYLTDLFPILELGTSAKMLSVVPLINGGGLFETGAGGSAPKHVQQLVEENHLRWDSLGEFLALAASLDHLATTADNERARILGETLDRATGTFLEENKSPSRKAGEIDNRGSHFYLALYWAQELARQDEDAELAQAFASVAEQLAANEDAINEELLSVQGRPADIGGYYRPDDAKTFSVMRPSETFNRVLSSLSA